MPWIPRPGAPPWVHERATMSLVCRRCTRLNPPDALYCYYDGLALNTEAVGGERIPAGKLPFLSPFVFPSGRSCHNFDELTAAAHELWAEGRELLKDGSFASFL